MCKKLTSIRLDLELLDTLVDIENDRRAIAAEKFGLKFIPYNRTSFLESLLQDKKKQFEEEGEM